MDRLNQPRKNLYISVPAGASHAYHSNDVVRGTVRVHPQTRPQRVTIAFRGRMKCRITRSNGQSSTTYKEKPDFFIHTLELFSSRTLGASYDILGLGVTEDDRVELPFEFKFPEVTEIKLGEKWSESKSTRFDCEAGAPLPPTFKRVTGANEQTVEYFLQAKLFGDSKYHEDSEVRCPLMYRPKPPPGILNSVALVQPDVWGTQRQHAGIWIYTHRLYPDYDPDAGLRDKFKHRWSKHRETTPFTNFRIAAACPAVLVAGEPMTLTLSLDHLERSKDIPDPPPVYLRRVRVRLISTLHVRIPQQSIFGSRDLNDDKASKTQLLDRHFITGDGEPLYDGMQLHSIKIPMEIAPAFKTYGLALDQKIEVQLWGECAKEKFERTPVHGTVMILSGRENSDQMGQEIEDGKLPAVDDDAPPPPYQVLDKNA